MNKKNSHACRQAGFTLFELLVSISIIAILVAIATVSYSNAQKKARDSRRVQDMNNLQKAMEQCYSINSYSYDVAVISGNSLTCNTQVLIDSIPDDPKPDIDYYFNVASDDAFCFCALLDAGTGGNSMVSDCSSFVADSSGSYYCVKNQQ